MEEKLADLLVDRFRLAALVEAGRLLDEGIASMRDVDLAMRAGAGYDAGPFAWADSVGLDVVKAKLEALYPEYGANYQVPPALDNLAKRGHLGEKTGRGFYEHAGRGT